MGGPKFDSRRRAAQRRLEFDVREGQDQLHAPNVFLGARTGIVPALPSQPGQIELRIVGPAAWLLDSALPLLGKRLSDARREALLRCSKALPSSSRAFQVDVMLARPVEAVRVCVIGLDYGKVAGFLRRIGLPGVTPELERRLAALVGGAGLSGGRPCSTERSSSENPRVFSGRITSEKPQSSWGRRSSDRLSAP